MGSKYQAYLEYKDSGVEWIGEIPCNWDMWKIAHACPYVASGTTPKSDSDMYYGGENLWVTTGELRESVIFDTEKKVTNKALIDMPTLRLHPKGSVSIAMYGATIGRLGIFGKEATTNQACCVMPPSSVLHNKYLFYWLYATRQEIINLSSGGGQPNVNQEKIASLKVSMPNYGLQIQIANFLDHETAKIDTLIEKQQQLIKLLKEKRQAVISHAVTKGLNPNAKMHDSGVEWLGEVPEHWEVKCLKRLLRLLTEKTDRRDNPIALENIQGWSGRFIPTETEFEGEGIAFERGDILFGKLRPYLAKIYLTESSGEAVGDFHVMRPIPEINGRFVMHQMLNRDFITIVNSSTFGAKMPRVAWDFMANMSLVIPPKNEQQVIINFLDNEISKFEALTTEAQTIISLLQERRTALISAAVTGKIDVRNWQAPNG